MKHSKPLPPLSPPAAFTAAERAYIRQAFGLHFSHYPRVADGILLRVWRSGPEAGQPKVPPAARSMIDRGLLEVTQIAPFPRAFFTKAGLAALCALASNPRYLDPNAYGHISRELAEAQPSDTVVKTT